MLKSAYLLAKIGADTAENERKFSEILPIGRRVADVAEHGRRRESRLAPRYVPEPVRVPHGPAVVLDGPVEAALRRHHLSAETALT